MTRLAESRHTLHEASHRMTSHFLQLFKRGRYVSIRSLAAGETNRKLEKKKHEERERFSVAAIAFCLEHDNRFKARFLRAIGGPPPASISKISVEPEHWGDLVLEGSRHVLVLEFKLGALLQDHQSPEARIFSVKGYGRQIRKRFGKSGKKLRYLVIGNRKNLRRRRTQISCAAVPWHKLYKLLVLQGEESQIETDLYDCLGILGVPVFLYRHMKNPTLNDDAKSAMTICGFLEHVLDTEGLQPGGSESGPECHGLNIPRAQNDKLANAVQPKGRLLGWIGYESVDEGKSPYLSVWFYSTPKAAARFRRRLIAALGSEPVKSLESDESTIIVRSAGDKSKDDAKWFSKVLKAAAGW